MTRLTCGASGQRGEEKCVRVKAKRAALASGAVGARSKPRGSWAARWRAVERRRVGHVWEKEEARGTRPIPGAGLTPGEETSGPGKNVGLRAKMREEFFSFLVFKAKPISKQIQV